MIMTIRNKNVISITVKRADYESKTPDYPGNHRELDQDDKSKTATNSIFPQDLGSSRRIMLPWLRSATPSKHISYGNQPPRKPVIIILKLLHI